MPVCRYELLDGGPDGAPVEFAIVGQQIYHKWTCDTETGKAYGQNKMQVICFTGIYIIHFTFYIYIYYLFIHITYIYYVFGLYFLE